MPEKENSTPKNLYGHLSEQDLLLLQAMVLKRTGIHLASDKTRRLYSRIEKRIKQLGIANFSEYVNFLLDNNNEEEIFVNLIANTSTAFFRENEHFEYLKKVYLPPLLEKNARIRIWSACCSTGEEPYSIAIIVNELMPVIGQQDIKILATDINTHNLAVAKTGVYAKNKIAALSPYRKLIYFKEIDKTGEVRISDYLKEIITFNQLNLIDPWPMRGPFNVIFIRNTLIYFQKEMAKMILKKMDALLEPGGLLIVGHSETLRNTLDDYELIGNSIYKKLLT